MRRDVINHVGRWMLVLSLCANGLAQEPEAPPPTDATVKAIRPAWDPGRTIKASSWDYEGPVQTVYTPQNAPAAPRLEDLPLRESITQYDITWTFDRPVRVGQFITGDWYVVGPVTVVAITPVPLFGEAVKEHGDWELIEKGGVTESRYEGQWARNGSVLNQRVDTGLGGFDSRLSHRHYDPRQFAPLPIEMKPGDSLISTISARDPLVAYSGHGQPLLTAAVLTCMDAPQPADAFRPSYCDTQNKVYLARNLRRDLLHRLERPAAAPESPSEFARLFQRPWLDTVSWGYANPELNTPRYGQRITNSVSNASLLLQLDYPELQKEQLLVHFVQYGIDLWGIVRAGSKGWGGHGGFGGGRKWTLIFAGIMLEDPDMREPNRAYPNVVFGEDTQTAWGKSWTGHDVVFTSHPAWTDPKTASPELEHPTRWAEVRRQDRGRRGDQSDGYRRCCTSIEWGGQALAAHLMGATAYWDYDPFFAYVDRWMETEDIHATGKATLDAAAAAAAANPESHDYSRGVWILQQPRSNPLVLEMWSRYRHNLPQAPAGAPQP